MFKQLLFCFSIFNFSNSPIFQLKRLCYQRIPNSLLAYYRGLNGRNIVFTLAMLQAGDQFYSFDATGVSTIAAEPELVYPTWGLFALTAVISILSLITIFLFKKRMLQIRLCIFNGILMLGFYALFGFFVWILKDQLAGAALSVKIALSFPIIALILDYLAIRNIGADEALVRSLDRLR